MEEEILNEGNFFGKINFTKWKKNLSVNIGGKRYQNYSFNNLPVPKSTTKICRRYAFHQYWYDIVERINEHFDRVKNKSFWRMSC